MSTFDWRNARYNWFGTIDMEIDHPDYGWIPFTADPGDPEEHGRALHAAALADGNVLPYVPAPPEPEPVPLVISRRQFYQGLAMETKISREEALAAIKSGEIPAPLQAMIDAMSDVDEQFAAEMLLAGAGDFQRDHPLVAVIATAQGMTNEDVDDFWRLCAAL